MDERKPLPLIQHLPEHGLVQQHLAHRVALVQGLTLVHFSPQPEPFLTQNTP